MTNELEKMSFALTISRTKFEIWIKKKNAVSYDLEFESLYY